MLSAQQLGTYKAFGSHRIAFETCELLQKRYVDFRENNKYHHFRLPLRQDRRFVVLGTNVTHKAEIGLGAKIYLVKAF
jgi:hypothetical protein